MANFQLLNNVDHQDLKVIIDRSAEFGDNVWYAVTFPAEFRNLQRHYPIFFVKHPDSGEFQAVAMFGVVEGENLFLDENGWNASYIPLNIMRQPFLIGFQEREQNGGVQREPVITVDMDHPRVNTECGEPVFLLIESFVLDVQLDDGSEHRLAGFYTINEDVLKELDGEQLHRLNQKGYLEAIYMVIASMTNLPALLEKKNRQRKVDPEHVDH
jgi:hypothetical protein